MVHVSQHSVLGEPSTFLMRVDGCSHTGRGITVFHAREALLQLILQDIELVERAQWPAGQIPKSPRDVYEAVKNYKYPGNILAQLPDPPEKHEGPRERTKVQWMTGGMSVQVYCHGPYCECICKSVEHHSYGKTAYESLAAMARYLRVFPSRYQFKSLGEEGVSRDDLLGEITDMVLGDRKNPASKYVEVTRRMSSWQAVMHGHAYFWGHGQTAAEAVQNLRENIQEEINEQSDSPAGRDKKNRLKALLARTFEAIVEEDVPLDPSVLSYTDHVIDGVVEAVEAVQHVQRVRRSISV